MLTILFRVINTLSKYENNEYADENQLDEDSQLFLCLQDLSMKKFLNKLDSAQSLLKNQERKRVMVVFTDKKYNIKDLKNEFGEPTDRETVVKNLHQVTIYFGYESNCVCLHIQAYDAVYPCILRGDLNTPVDPFFKDQLAKCGPVNYLSANNWEVTIEATITNILTDLHLIKKGKLLSH